MKRLIIMLFLLVGFAYEAGAVLKEKDLEQTLTILQAELEQYNQELSVRSAARRERMKRLVTQLLQTMKHADQTAMMLYSQQQDNVFDLTYACHEATKQYKEFHKKQLPFTDFLEKTEKDIARYDSLIQRLEGMPDLTMTQYGDQKRDTCLVLARSIRSLLEGNAQQLRQNIRFYDQTELRLKEQNDYAQKRYSDIQKSIFLNGGDNYLTLLSNIGRRWKQVESAVAKKYDLDPDSQSRWSAVWILGTFVAIFIYVLIAVVTNQLFFRFLMPRRFRTTEFLKKRAAIIMATTVITFAIIQGAFLVIGSGRNFPFLYMAASLLVEREERPVGQCHPHLRPADRRGLHRHRLPYHPHPQRTGKPRATARAAALRPVAVARHPSSQPEHPALGHLLHLRLPDGVHRLRRLFIRRLHAAGRATAHLVDHATHLHPDHHLSQPLPGDLRQEETAGREAHHADMGLPAGGEDDPARAERDVDHAEHLLGRQRVQPGRHVLETLQIQLHRHAEPEGVVSETDDGRQPLVPLPLYRHDCPGTDEGTLRDQGSHNG